MKTLYVSDLDGTLLRSDERLSEYTCKTINRLVEKGMLFSYATARSLITARKVTAGLDARIPLIVYNGAFVMDNVTSEILLANYFGNHVLTVLDHLFEAQVYPIVYAMIEGKERFSYVRELSTPAMNAFLNTRKGDVRTNVVETPEQLKKGNIFYITCMDDEEKLTPLYEEYRNSYHCVFQRDIYTGDPWLEIMPESASKANAVRQLGEMLGCERITAFGDGKNDIDLFEAADEGYAVENADEELKKASDGIILSNDEDAVARWLEERFSEQNQE